jgi:hypothetical protein
MTLIYILLCISYLLTIHAWLFGVQQNLWIYRRYSLRALRDRLIAYGRAPRPTPDLRQLHNDMPPQHTYASGKLH